MAVTAEVLARRPHGLPTGSAASMDAGEQALQPDAQKVRARPGIEAGIGYDLDDVMTEAREFLAAED